MNKKTVIFLSLVILLVIISSGCKIVKNKHIEKRNNSIDNQQPNSLTPGDFNFKIEYDDIERYYLLHIPQSYSNKPTPLILAFHGGMGTADNMAEKYDLITKSDMEGFIVAFLNGASRRPSGKIATWNAGNCCGYAVESNSDDVEFVKATINDIKEKVNIGKIYATGMSNGAMMSYRLACEMSDTFSAIAAVAGTDNYDDCNPKNPISILHIHSLIDQNVLFEGGCGSGCVTKDVDFTSVSKTISIWVNRNNCNKNPSRVLEKEGVYCDLYTECDKNTQVKLCVTEDGGHSWAGLKMVNKNNILEKSIPSQKISATDEIWNFFKSS